MPQPAERRSARRWRVWSLRAAPVLIVLVVAAGVVTRFVADSPMWLDEALTSNIAADPLEEIGDRLRHDGHPPLYYWLLHGWMEIAGDSDLAQRSLAGIFGVLTLPVAWFVGRRLGGTAAGGATLLVVAASPFLIRYSSENRPYSLVALLVLVGWLLLDRAGERPSFARLAPIPFVTGALLLSHYWTAFLIAAVGLGLLLTATRGAEAHQRASAWRRLLAVALGGVLFLPWVPALLYQLEHTGTPWATAVRPTVLWSAVFATLGSGAPEGQLLATVLVVLLVLGVFGVRRESTVVLARPAAGPTTTVTYVLVAGILLATAVSLITDSAFQPRYLATFIPVALVLAGVGLARLPLLARVALFTVIAVLAGAAVVHDLRRDRTQAEQIAAAIASQGSEGDLVVACPDQLAPALERALEGRFPLVAYPDFEQDPRFVEWVDYLERHEVVEPATAVAELLAERPAGSSIWLVWSSDYRIVGDECALVAEQLGLQTASGTVVINREPNVYFENADLNRYQVPS